MSNAAFTRTPWQHGFEDAQDRGWNASMTVTKHPEQLDEYLRGYKAGEAIIRLGNGGTGQISVKCIDEQIFCPEDRAPRCHRGLKARSTFTGSGAANGWACYDGIHC